MTLEAQSRPEAATSLAGLVITDSRTGMRAVLERLDEREGTGFEVLYELPPGSGPYIFPEHWHRTWHERFDVLSGEARYTLGGRKGELVAGQGVDLPPGVPHLHPWNTGSEVLRMRQTTNALEADPTVLRNTIHAVAMFFWLSRRGLVNRRGVPALLPSTPIAEVLQRGGIYLPHVPVAVQEWLVPKLAAWARRKGHPAFDPACLR